MNKYKIQALVERLFVLAGLIILLMTLIIGFYFNHYDAKEKQKESIEKSHAVLSQLVVPSLAISDISEIRHLLFMASDDNETYLVVTNQHTIIMSDYGVTDFSGWLSQLPLNSCRGLDDRYEKINGVNYLVNCSSLDSGLRSKQDQKLGVLLSFTRYNFFQFSFLVIYFVAVLIAIFLAMIVAFRRIMHYRLIRPLLILKDSVMPVSGDKNLSVVALQDIVDAPIEVVEIKDAFERLLSHLQVEYGRRIESEKNKALVDLAAGVAHDIRSPIVALDVITKDIQSIPEDQRLIIRHAATRIKDIANNLLSQYKKKDLDPLLLAETLNAELISDILSSLVSEKRVQYRYHLIKFSIDISESAYGKFSLVNAANLNRILSNIIDNSVEAGSSDIAINLSVVENAYQSVLIISVVDDGDGMPASVLEKINLGIGVTSKAGGHGLGLVRAIKTIQDDWRGEMSVASSVGCGTKINIMLPRTESPQWFLQALNVSSFSKIVIIDDDESIHQVWKERFKKLNIEVSYMDYYCPEELIKNKNIEDTDSFIYLIDYEFVNSRLTGLELIDAIDISKYSYLVTSRYEDLKIQEKVIGLGIKIIPKTHAVNIPIEFIEAENCDKVDCIFIDNDEAIRLAWLFRARLRGISLKVYPSTHEFTFQMASYRKSTPIYIDSRLDEGVNGEDFARFLHDSGFENIILTTAHHPDSFSEMYWISSIIGKEPPF